MFDRHRTAISTVAVALTALGLASCGGGGGDDVGQAASREGKLASVEEVASLAQAVPKDIRQSGTMRVVMSTSSPPAHFTTESGMEGADADLAILIGKVLGLKTEVIGVPLDQILPGLQAKRYDAVISQFSPTTDRAKVLDFVNYAQSGTALGVPTDNPKDLTVDTLCGQRVGVQKGSSQAAEDVPEMSAQCRKAGEAAIEMSTFPESTAAVLGLQSDRVDAVLLDSPVLGYAIQQAEGTMEMAGTLNDQPVAIGTIKGSGLHTSIQGALEYLDEKKALENTFEQWGMTNSAIHEFEINELRKE